MKASWNDQIIAEADKSDLIYIEGNWYFPPDSIKKEYYKSNDHHTQCPWKGNASYYDIDVGGEVNENGAWYYPKPMDSAIEKVKKDFTNFVAFWNGITVTE